MPGTSARHFGAPAPGAVQLSCSSYAAGTHCPSAERCCTVAAVAISVGASASSTKRPGAALTMRTVAGGRSTGAAGCSGPAGCATCATGAPLTPDVPPPGSRCWLAQLQRTASQTAARWFTTLAIPFPTARRYCSGARPAIASARPTTTSRRSSAQRGSQARTNAHHVRPHATIRSRPCTMSDGASLGPSSQRMSPAVPRARIRPPWIPCRWHQAHGLVRFWGSSLPPAERNWR
jgi:hypothetical protein